MAVIDYSIGFTQLEVEEILTTQKAELKKTLASYADNGSSVTKRRIDGSRSAATTAPGRKAEPENPCGHRRLSEGAAEDGPGDLWTTPPGDAQRI